MSNRSGSKLFTEGDDRRLGGTRRISITPIGHGNTFRIRFTLLGHRLWDDTIFGVIGGDVGRTRLIFEGHMMSRVTLWPGPFKRNLVKGVTTRGHAPSQGWNTVRRQKELGLEPLRRTWLSFSRVTLRKCLLKHRVSFNLGLVLLSNNGRTFLNVKF